MFDGLEWPLSGKTRNNSTCDNMLSFFVFDLWSSAKETTQGISDMILALSIVSKKGGLSFKGLMMMISYFCYGFFIGGISLSEYFTLLKLHGWKKFEDILGLFFYAAKLDLVFMKG